MVKSSSRHGNHSDFHSDIASTLFSKARSLIFLSGDKSQRNMVDVFCQESRRINVAVWQDIVYNEFLPIVLGSEAHEKYGLSSDGGGIILGDVKYDTQLVFHIKVLYE